MCIIETTFTKITQFNCIHVKYIKFKNFKLIKDLDIYKCSYCYKLPCSTSSEYPIP